MQAKEVKLPGGCILVDNEKEIDLIPFKPYRPVEEPVCEDEDDEDDFVENPVYKDLGVWILVLLVWSAILFFA